ncbi:hypothetical protein A6M21_08675 [Desulfotomaculum copahuensis]|uniref:Uncharacterized protein n=1 Tax=Desulfotomaculum copahuensis TaxID=1838280 RepID=A0A1B7LF87_9FIRM|nr:hypothetical protein A6M21_08675 [Desulfotomaculum copahuensis]
MARKFRRRQALTAASPSVTVTILPPCPGWGASPTPEAEPPDTTADDMGTGVAIALEGLQMYAELRHTPVGEGITPELWACLLGLGPDGAAFLRWFDERLSLTAHTEGE